MVKELKLSRGMVAVVDDDDYEWLSRYKWTLQIRPSKRQTRYYAGRLERTDGKTRMVYMHRAIMRASEGACVDHIDRDGLNNRKSNLRKCDHSQNGANANKGPGYTSKYKGVCRHQGKWAAYIRCREEHRCLGRFETEEDAAKAYARAAKELFGDFANA